jgi:ribosomal protein L37AE/L43A
MGDLNFAAAVTQMVPKCPYCGDQSNQMEQVNPTIYYCNTCGKLSMLSTAAINPRPSHTISKVAKP